MTAQENLSQHEVETPAQTEARLRAAYEADSTPDETRWELARFLIRSGKTDEGAVLIEQPFQAGKSLELEDWILALELDRLHSNSSRAAELLDSLKAGREDRWPSSQLWLTVGILCQEYGLEDGRLALEYALELDPNNRPLRNHLQMTSP